MTKVTRANIIEEANKGNIKVLNHPDVVKVWDDENWAPLILLSNCCDKLNSAELIKLLKHPSIDKDPSCLRFTPLHNLALFGIKAILKHPSVDKVIDSGGKTPLHYLAKRKKVSLAWLKKKYPWFKFKKGTIVTSDLITDILNYPNAAKFIEGIK